MARCAGGVCALPGGQNMATNPIQLQKAGKGLGTYANFPLYNPQQTNVMSQLLGMAQGQLRQQGGPTGGGPGGPNNWQQYFDFAPIEQQARTQFNTQTVPSLAERFTSMGGEGGQRSSAFQGALGRAGAGLEEGLAALKAQYALPQAQLAQNQQGMQLNQLQTLLGGGLNRQFEGSYFRRQPQGFWENFLNKWSGAYGQ